VSKRANGSLRADLLDRNAKSAQGSSQQHNATGGSHQEYVKDHPHIGTILTLHSSKHPTAENATDVPEETEQLDEAALIELRRKRREAIKAKYKGAATPLLVQALHINDESRSATPAQNNSAEDSVQSTREGQFKQRISSTTLTIL
jgi:serine/threonine-protein kinase PRP4